MQDEGRFSRPDALILVRHAEAMSNVGHPELPDAEDGLTAAGSGQAEAVAWELSALYDVGARGAPVLLVSSLRRARETALPIQRALGTPPSFVARLREQESRESATEVLARFDSVVAGLREGTDAVFVTHGNVIRLVLARCLGLADAPLYAVNASISVLHRDPVRVVAFNLFAHLVREPYRATPVPLMVPE